MIKAVTSTGSVGLDSCFRGVGLALLKKKQIQTKILTPGNSNDKQYFCWIQVRESI